MKKKDLAIYIHIPFCERKCLYCDFCSSVGTPQEIGWYMRKLMTEIRSFQALGNLYLVRSVFFGGGTPSILDPMQIMRVLVHLRDHFQMAEDLEITMECNPGTLTEEKLAEYRTLGVNRLSIGLQSADNEELKMLGRIHTWEDFIKNYQAARKMGFRNINVDLMQSLPDQTLDGWKKTLEKVVTLLPEHISAYSLTLEEGTPFYRMYAQGEGKRHMPDERTDREMYRYTGKYLAQHGYHRYEISNYARGDHECRHNITYWTGGDYIGFGQSAASCLDGKRFSNSRDGGEYRRNIALEYENFKRMPEPSVRERMEEFMFLGLRMMRGISEDEFEQRFGVSYEAVYGEVTEKLAGKKLLTREKGRVALTEYGIDVSNRVLAEFLL